MEKLEKTINKEIEKCNWTDIAKTDMDIILKYNVGNEVKKHYERLGCLECDGKDNLCLSYFKQQN